MYFDLAGEPGSVVLAFFSRSEIERHGGVSQSQRLTNRESEGKKGEQ